MTRINRSLVIEYLVELSDEKRQRELWLSSECPSSFIEAVCGLFDDSVLGDALDLGETEFGNAIDSKLRDLERTLSVVDDNQELSCLIADPRMNEVRTMAAEILEMIERAHR